ncbi:SDR family NAD(P)-dependent oxidoreductase [Rhodococcus sp. NPDC055024]
MPRLLMTGRSDIIGAAIAAGLTDKFDDVINIDSERSAPNDIIVDMTDHEALARAVDAVEGPIDGLVLAHRIGDPGAIDSMTSTQWRRTLNYNLTSLFVIISRALPKMTNSSSIVVVGSTAGFDHSAYAGIDYTVSRWGTNGLVRHFAAEFGPQGIRINAVCVGWVNLSTENKDPEGDFSSIPLRRPAQPNEVGSMVKFLLSDASSYMSGALVPVSGGW